MGGFHADSGENCFPDDALVTLLSGEERRMDQLQIGDEVRCLKGNQVNFCTVTTFTDREVGTPHLYYSLVHAHGALELSRRHMVYVVPANLTATCRPLEIEDATLSPLPHADSCYTYAERVRVGDRIAVFSKDASVMTLEPIMAVEQVVKAGKITPLTNGGARIIVNNVLTTSISDAPAGEASSALFLVPLTQSLDTRRAEDISGIHPFCKPFVASVPLFKEAYEAGVGNEINVAHALKRANASGGTIEFADISAYSLLHQNLGLPVDSTVAWLLKPALRTLFAALEWGVGRDAMIESMNARLRAALEVMKKNSQ